MDQQKIVVNGTSIHVRTAGTNGTPIVFIHGNSASSLAFQKQLDSSLARRYRLIALDLPGHGNSHAASDIAIYSLPGYAQVVAEVVAHFDASDGIFVGWSLGGHIVLEALTLLKHARGVLIYGTPPLGKPPAMMAAFLPHPAAAFALNSELTDKQISNLASSFFQPGYLVPHAFFADVRRTHGAARLSVGTSLGIGNYADEVQIVAQCKCPLAVLHGARDQLVNGAYLNTLTMPTLWRQAIQIVPDAGHALQWEKPTTFNAMLDQFALSIVDVTDTKLR